jgi:site-specific recombinase XerD
LPATKRHPHVLKHSIASHLVRQNVNLAKVKTYLGHAAISSTMKYVAVSDQEACFTLMCWPTFIIGDLLQ